MRHWGALDLAIAKCLYEQWAARLSLLHPGLISTASLVVGYPDTCRPRDRILCQCPFSKTSWDTGQEIGDNILGCTKAVSEERNRNS